MFRADEAQIAKDVMQYTHDPLGFVVFAFPWGKGELEGFTGPSDWQIEILHSIGESLRDGKMTTQDVLQYAIAAGNGVGKSVIVAWLILWGMSTFEDCRGVVTANTENQLRTKTWAELAKWHRMCITRHWFTLTATAIYSTDLAHEKTWRVDQIPWSENKPEAFAGLHNQGKRVLLFFDESSAIPDIIWETAEGALTDEHTEIIWAVFGNPTRNNGRFHQCFHSHRHRWFTKHIDSRTCSITNKEKIRKWVEDYGEDSDFVRVHVRGVFPSASNMQFIPNDLVELARGKHLREEEYRFAPVVIGVDPSWTGGDETVIVLRQGLMSKILAVFQKNDNDSEIAGHVAHFEDQYKADGVFIDLGWGTGIYSAGKQMGRKWTLVAFGGKSTDEGLLNKRAEMWSSMKKWLQEGGTIPDDPVLCADLTGVEYRVGETGANMGKTFLESKESMRDRGLGSPNRADALCLTFAFPVRSKGEKRLEGAMAQARPYDPLSMEIKTGEQKRFDPLLLNRSFN